MVAATDAFVELDFVLGGLLTICCRVRGRDFFFCVMVDDRYRWAYLQQKKRELWLVNHF